MGESATFGERLRRYREATGYSQEGLAERAGLTANAISALERGERKRPYPDTLRRLADALGLGEAERSELSASVSRARGGGTTPPAEESPEAVPIAPRLPGELTGLVGREREAEVVLHLLSRPDVRLLTLTGPGGVGKTRLALRVAGEVGSGYPDGVFWVSLAPLGDPGLVLSTIARLLGLAEAAGRDPREALGAYLRDRRALLVLDNFEHVLEAARDVAGLLLSCPRVDVLATSRAPLGMRGEQECPVPPLELPPATPVRREGDVAAAASVQLFVRRAREASPSFELTPDNAAEVASICRRLDGLPLALELAAVRVKLLTPAEMLPRLDRSLPLLTGGPRDVPERQRTMRAAIEWSYQLLGDTERALFRTLSVFQGGWDLEAAEVVGEGGDVDRGQVLELLGRLADQSLVVAGCAADGSSRYRMLEPVRQYALEKLAESEEDERARRRHAGFYMTLAEAADAGLMGPRQVEWVGRLEAEVDNLRASMAWLLDRGAREEAVRLGWSLRLFMLLRSRYREARGWMEEILTAGDLISDGARARTLCGAGLMVLQEEGGHGHALTLFEEALPLSRTQGDIAGTAEASTLAGLALLNHGDPERAVLLLEDGLQLYRSLGDRWNEARLLAFLGVAPLNRGDYALAEEYFDRALALARPAGNLFVLFPPLYYLAVVGQARGDYSRASERYGEALTLSIRMGDVEDAAMCLRGLAECAGALGEPDRAARLYGAVEAALESLGAAFDPLTTTPAFHERYLELARDQTDARVWTVTWAEGRAMSLDEAVEYALRHEKKAR